MNDIALLAKWTTIINRSNWVATAFSRIYELHFKQEYLSGTKRKRLRLNAIPTENLTDPLQELNILIDTGVYYK